MKQINRQRRLGEINKHYKLVTRNTKKKFHPENSITLSRLIDKILRISLLYNTGFNNAQKIRVETVDFSFPNLPTSFHDYKILFISDLHIDCYTSLAELIWKKCRDMEYDCLLLGGDYRFRAAGNPSLALKQLNQLLPRLVEKSPVYAILGNHDNLEIGLELENLGVKVLLNDSVKLQKCDEFIELVGLDDGHYYNSEDFNEAEENVKPDHLKILLSHSPEFYQEAATRKYDLMLSGHTHGGQICLPGKIALIKEAPVPRKILSGRWNYHALQGYTSCGVGCSMVPVRFNCPPEIVEITLKKL